MGTAWIEDGDYLEAFEQAAAAGTQLDPAEQDRRSELIRRMHFELNQREELRLRGSS